MESSLFSAVPSFDNSDRLNQMAKEIICGKLSSIIDQVGHQVGMNLSEEVAGFLQVPEGLINPALFYYYFALKDAISSKKLVDIIDTISLVCNESIGIKRNKDQLPLIKSAIDSEWERNLFNSRARKEPVSEHGEKCNYEIVNPVFYSDMKAEVVSIKSAVEVLKNLELAHYYTAIDKLNAIKIFEGTVRGFSYQSVYGNIYIRKPRPADDSVAYYLEHIVHESAHQFLFGLQLLDPIILNDKADLYDAPIRIQKRPMDGIFHACFVLSRMMRCFRKTKDVFESKVNSAFLEKIERWYKKSYHVVIENAKLTNNGKILLKTISDCAYG